MAQAAGKWSLPFVLFVSATAASCSFPETHFTNLSEAWDYENDPSHFDVTPKRFSSLPRSGELPEDRFPWSDDYWPTYAGGVSRRWQTKNFSRDYKSHIYNVMDETIFANTPPTLDIAKLSPAEKFDLYLDRYDFPLTKLEQKKMLKSVDSKTGKVPTWFGICHGVAPASLMEPEPGEVLTVKNAKGIEIPFYPSDIKALLSDVYASAGGTNRFVGLRCQIEDHELKTDSRGRVANPECRDVNPGAFHLILAELLGKPDKDKRQGFIFDINATSEVWNYVAVGYHVKHSSVVEYDASNDPLSSFRAPKTAQLANIAVYVNYTVYSDPSKKPLREDHHKYTKTAYFAYTLELDANGVIIGGEWKNTYHPDFIWMLKTKPKGTDLLPYAKVQELLAMSRGEAPEPPSEVPTSEPDNTPPSPADPAAGIGGGLTPHALGLPEFPLPIF